MLTEMKRPLAPFVGEKSNVPAELDVPRAENQAAGGGVGGGAGVDDAPGQRAARHMSSLITASIVRSSSRRNLIPPVRRVQPGASADRKLEKASMARERARAAVRLRQRRGWRRLQRRLVEDGWDVERREAWCTTC